MVIQHVNKRGNTYYLHQSRTKTGKVKWFFSMEKGGELANSIPDGYEIYENPNAQVFLRKKLPKLVTEEEVATVQNGIRELAKLPYFALDVKGKSIIVHLPNQDAAFFGGSQISRLGIKDSPALVTEVQKFLTYSPMMRFSLVDEKRRLFSVDRWCFLGSIDDWFPLAGSSDLSTLVRKYVPHLGKESFYNLM